MQKHNEHAAKRSRCGDYVTNIIKRIRRDIVRVRVLAPCTYRYIHYKCNVIYQRTLGGGKFLRGGVCCSGVRDVAPFSGALPKTWHAFDTLTKHVAQNVYAKGIVNAKQCHWVV